MEETLEFTVVLEAGRAEDEPTLLDYVGNCMAEMFTNDEIMTGGVHMEEEALFDCVKGGGGMTGVEEVSAKVGH